MSRLDYLCERESVVFAIEEELERLERLAPAREEFSDDELDALHQSVLRLNRFISNLEADADDDRLPYWLQRKPPAKPARQSADEDKSSESA